MGWLIWFRGSFSGGIMWIVHSATPRLWSMKYRDLIKLIESAGWQLHHSKGSHLIFRHSQRAGSIVIAGGGKISRDVPKGTEQAILRQAGLK
jgi:predicted RNA binding protein YcfA (HicA-like mRNA interferase family)